MSDQEAEAGTKTIRVLVAIDTEGLLEDFPKASQNRDDPTFVTNPDKYIYMIVKDKYKYHSTGGAELTFAANTGDSIRWHGQSAAVDSEGWAVLYRFVSKDQEDKISQPKTNILTVKSPLPKNSGVANGYPLQWQSIKYNFWVAEVNNPGEVTYSFYFVVPDEEQNKDRFFSWDPHIHIEER